MAELNYDHCGCDHHGDHEGCDQGCPSMGCAYPIPAAHRALRPGDRILVRIVGEPDRVLKVASDPVTEGGLTSFTAIDTRYASRPLRDFPWTTP